MAPDPALASLIEQAERNLKTLRLLVTNVELEPDLDRLQQQFEELRRAYLKETDSLTRQVLKRAVERRRGADRRKRLNAESVGT
jgi:sensor domain CHASE-containing protein